MSREFFKFVIPSMIAFSFSGIYSIVDGWFVGNYLNETGLAAINVAYPNHGVHPGNRNGVGDGRLHIHIYLSRKGRE